MNARRMTSQLDARRMASQREERQFQAKILEAQHRFGQQVRLPETDTFEKPAFGREAWNVPTQRLGKSRPARESLKEERQETIITLEDEVEDWDTMLKLIEYTADKHRHDYGVIPGQIRIMPFKDAFLNGGRPANYIDHELNEIIPIVDDPTLPANTVRCVSNRKFIL
jgi:hypothetical protein